MKTADLVALPPERDRPTNVEQLGYPHPNLGAVRRGGFTGGEDRVGVGGARQIGSPRDNQVNLGS